MVVLVQNDVDDNGVKNKFGERGGEHHHPGTGITDLQNDTVSQIALKAFQGAHGLEQTGKIDEPTQQKLKGACNI